MKLLSLLAFILPLLYVLDAGPINSDDNPFSNMSELETRILELMFSEMPKTQAETFSLSCFSWFCHFEDKNGCRNECKKLGKLRLSEKDRILRDNGAEHIPYWGTDVKLCAAQCMLMMPEGSESQKVCENVCIMETSHPDREKWVQQSKELHEKARQRNLQESQKE